MGNKYLIGGRAGTGKTTVYHELQQRGLNAIDGDKFPGLTRAEEIATGQPVQVDWSKYVDWTKIAWNWQPNVLQGILGSKKTIYLCASASNDLEYAPLFDKFFVLTLDQATHRQRLASDNRNYGKHQVQRDEIIAEQADFIYNALWLGAVAIDSARPVKQIVDDILSYTNET